MITLFGCNQVDLNLTDFLITWELKGVHFVQVFVGAFAAPCQAEGVFTLRPW